LERAPGRKTEVRRRSGAPLDVSKHTLTSVIYSPNEKHGEEAACTSPDADLLFAPSFDLSAMEIYRSLLIAYQSSTLDTVHSFKLHW